MLEERPWGTFETVHEDSSFKVKIIKVKPGHRLSLQAHMMRDERWCGVAGRGIVTTNKTSSLEKGDTIFIPAGKKHRIKNIGENELVFVEVQTGSYLGEDDITRFDDDYGRL